VLVLPTELPQTARRTRNATAFKRRIRAAVRILVVDGDDCVRELLCERLRKAGYDAEAAADAIDAGHRVLSQMPDLIIAASELPYMDGFEFVAALNADPVLCDIPVVLTAASDGRLERERAARLGVVACLAKPLPKQQVLEVVARFTSRQQAA
jgi:CheY-like chemotaxis protein